MSHSWTLGRTSLKCAQIVGYGPFLSFVLLLEPIDQRGRGREQGAERKRTNPTHEARVVVISVSSCPEAGGCLAIHDTLIGDKILTDNQAL